jgi:hypothetical protein
VVGLLTISLALMVLQKVAISPFLSFPRKRESSKFKEFWTPAGVYPELDTGQ